MERRLTTRSGHSRCIMHWQSRGGRFVIRLPARLLRPLYLCCDLISCAAGLVGVLVLREAGLELREVVVLWLELPYIIARCAHARLL